MMTNGNINPDLSPVLPGERLDDEEDRSYPMNDENYIEDYDLPFCPTGDDELPY